MENTEMDIVDTVKNGVSAKGVCETTPARASISISLHDGGAAKTFMEGAAHDIANAALNLLDTLLKTEDVRELLRTALLFFVMDKVLSDGDHERA